MCKQMDKIRADLQTFQQTGELPAAWEPDPELSDAEFDRRVDEINREMADIIECGSIDSDHPLHPNHSIQCQRPCCRPLSWEP